MLEIRIGFIGAGQMATALARGFVRASLVGGDRIVAFDPVPAAGEQFCRTVDGAKLAASNAQVATSADVLFLAVKPQFMPEVIGELKSVVDKNTLVVSIAAGVTLGTLADGMGTDRIVRVMPNTPFLVGQGAAGFAMGAGATESDKELVAQLLGALGVAIPLKESLLDAVTGLSGSGPAYVYLLIEALSDGGVRMGLPRDTATTLAARTVAGAAEMVLATGEHPAVLKDRVASPGGTTIAGLQKLEEHGVRAALIAAVEAATNRATELGRS